MQQDLATPRKHPAALASIVIAGVAVTALALVTIAYLLGWIPMRGVAPSPVAMATPGQQVTGVVQQGGVDLLPGETLVAPADPPPKGMPVPAAPAAPAMAPEPAPRATPRPVTPQYDKPAPRKAPAPPNKALEAAMPSTPYATVLPSRAAPGKPDYTREAPVTSFERSRNICVNCGAVASIGSFGGDWEVRVRFDDGSTETLRYRDRPRLRIGDRVHLEDGRLIAE